MGDYEREGERREGRRKRKGSIYSVMEQMEAMRNGSASGQILNFLVDDARFA